LLAPKIALSPPIVGQSSCTGVETATGRADARAVPPRPP
jgi:hypothetical protein